MHQSLLSKTELVAINIVPYNGSSYGTTLSGRNTPTQVTIPSDCKGCYIRIAVPTINSTVNETVYPMISEYDNSFVPYGTLLSAPVESVVSQGVNLFEQKNWITRLSTSKVSIEGEYFSILKTDGGTTEYICKSFYVPVTGSYLLKCDEVVNTSATLSSVGYSITDAPLTTYSAATATFTMPGNQSNAVSVTAGKYINITFTLISNKTGVLKYKNMRLVKSEYASEPFIPYNKTTVLVPSAVKNLPDYGCSFGDAANEIDFESGVYYHRVGSKYLKDFTWTLKDSSRKIFQSSLAGIKRTSSNTDIPNIVTGKYTTVSSGTTWVTGMISMYESQDNIYICDTSCADLTAFVNSLGNQIAVYELADSAKETIPLTDYIRPLPVENGGTITLVNEHNLDMPSVIKYKKEV